VHGAVTALLPLLAAEKSKVPWFIAGGVLALWAMIVSVGLGFRKANFPGGAGGQRAVIAISVVLVAVALSAAVVTSGSPAKSGEGAPAAKPSHGPESGSGSSQAPPVGASGAVSSGATSTTPKATTGTPAPPSSPARSGSASSLSLSANATQLSFNTRQLSARAGTVTVTFTNPGALEHNVTIAQGSSVLGATPTFTGGSRKLTLTLKPGSYTFYCSVPGHRAAGMEGTLSVT
jgi:plastocyanin